VAQKATASSVVAVMEVVMATVITAIPNTITVSTDID
jgi:hypothetical protein